MHLPSVRRRSVIPFQGYTFAESASTRNGSDPTWGRSIVTAGHGPFARLRAFYALASGPVAGSAETATSSRKGGLATLRSRNGEPGVLEPDKVLLTSARPWKKSWRRREAPAARDARSRRLRGASATPVSGWAHGRAALCMLLRRERREPFPRAWKTGPFRFDERSRNWPTDGVGRLWRLRPKGRRDRSRRLA